MSLKQLERGRGREEERPGNKVVVETFNDSLKMLCLISTARVMAIGTKRRLLFSVFDYFPRTGGSVG